MAGSLAPHASPRAPHSAAAQHALPRTPLPLALVVSTAAFIVVAVVILAPQFMQAVRSFSLPVLPLHATRVNAPPATAPALAPSDLDLVLSYAQSMRPDDTLVQVRPGVFAKRSNVQGIQVNGMTLYYDILPHQSYGPLRTGTLDESRVTVLARDGRDGFLVIVYTPK